MTVKSDTKSRQAEHMTNDEPIVIPMVPWPWQILSFLFLL